MQSLIPLLTAIIALFFALTVMDQYLQRRRSYQLVWTVALFIWVLGSFSQFLWEAGVTQQAVYRTWYLAGAMLVPAYLGAGTLYLLTPRKVAHSFMALLLVCTLLAILFAMTAVLQKPLDELRPINPEGTPLKGGFLPFFPVVVLTILLNIYGTFTLVGGALWSAAVFARRRTMPHRVISNILIATGALTAALGGTLERLGMPEPHAVALLLGVLVIYVGFLRSQEVFQFYRIPFLGDRRALKTR